MTSIPPSNPPVAAEDSLAALLSRPLLVAALMLSMAVVASFWLVEYLPTHDGPNHILQGFLATHLHDHGKGYAAFLRPNVALTSLGFYVFLSPLAAVLPWRDALRVTLSTGALIWAWGFLVLIATVHRSRSSLGLLGFGLALGWPLYMGFLSYWCTVGLGWWVLVLALRPRGRSPTRRETALLAAALLALAVAHAFVAEVVGVTIATVAIARSSRRDIGRTVIRLALMGLPAVILVGLSGMQMGPRYPLDYVGQDQTTMLWLPWGDRLAMLWRCSAGGAAWRGAVPALLGVAGLLHALRAMILRRLPRDEAALAIACALALVATLALPFHSGGWQFFSVRFVPFVVAFGIALLPIERLRLLAPRRALALGLGVFSVASVAWAGAYHRRLAHYSAAALAGLRAPIHRSGPRLPLMLRPIASEVAYASPELNLGHLYAMEQGGMTPYLFATRLAVSPHMYAGPRLSIFPPFPGRFFGAAMREGPTPIGVQLTYVALLGSAFEDVILWGFDSDIESFIARGYHADHRSAGLGILRYEGCGLDVHIATGPRIDTPLLVEYGWAPVLIVAGGARAPAGRTFSDGLAHLSLPRAPCGPLWARVLWDRDGSGTPTAGDGLCAGADRDGRLFLDVSRDRRSVYCVPGASLQRP